MGETSLESRETSAGSLEPARPLREELAERVETHRIRRAQMRGEPAESMTLEFDFDGAAGEQANPPEEPELFAVPADQEVFEIGEVEPPSLETEAASLDSLSLEKPDEAAQLLDSVSVEAGEPISDHETDEPPVSRPVEIVLDSPLDAAEGDGFEEATVSLPLAPMGRRFVAGVLDALVLLLSAGLFAFIFWRAGGHITPQPLNITVLASIPAFLIMAYFGLFTALTSTTPGLLWMGLEVRSMDGGVPAPQEAFWRAFGCLVSASALLLGFVWALVDSEGLTWHDRMSRTFLATSTSIDGSQERYSHPSTLNFRL
ncbi:MAG: RDD family protein [Acidobacteria bacterium]|nr:RDD family protein [Acidobacteriota bacterium]